MDNEGLPNVLFNRNSKGTWEDHVKMSKEVRKGLLLLYKELK
jgi:hypothetical protein